MSIESKGPRGAESTEYGNAGVPARPEGRTRSGGTPYRGAESTEYGSTRSGSTPYRGAESTGYGGAVILSGDEERELYVILKPRESILQGQLDGLLRRIEKSLFSRLTIEEIEKLAERFPRDVV